MNERDNFILKAKRIKLIEETKLKESNTMDVNNKMDIDVPEKRKSNFSSLGPLSGTNGSISARSNSSSSKGDIKKLVIKNFKSKCYMLVNYSSYFG